MSDTGGGSSVGLIAGAGIGGCAIVVGIIALVVYCYMKARKEKANTNMTKSTDVFTTGASNTQFDLPQRSRVNQFPDPGAAKRSRQKGRETERDKGHVNTAYSRNSSDNSSNSSDVEGRDLSPPRVRKPRGDSYASDTSNDTSSLDEEIPGGETNFRMEKETDRRARGSYKKARQNNILDPTDTADGSRNKRREPESQHTSRRDMGSRNPRSDSPLTIGTLKKHEEITGGGSDSHDNKKSNVNRVKKRDNSPSTKTYESSETGVTTASSHTAGTEFTATTVSSGSRFVKNPSLRRNSPARSSSQRRYRKDHETDEKGRRKPRRTHSAERERSERQSQRSKSPGSGSGSERSGSSSRSGSQRSSRRSRSEQQRQLKEQAILPIFQDAKKKKGSNV